MHGGVPRRVRSQSVGGSSSSSQMLRPEVAWMDPCKRHSSTAAAAVAITPAPAPSHTSSSYSPSAVWREDIQHSQSLATNLDSLFFQRGADILELCPSQYLEMTKWGGRLKCLQPLLPSLKDGLGQDIPACACVATATKFGTGPGDIL